MSTSLGHQNWERIYVRLSNGMNDEYDVEGREVLEIDCCIVYVCSLGYTVHDERLVLSST